MLDYLKKEVCELSKRAQRNGLCKHKSGNFSARDPESGLFVFTPTGVDRELLTPRDMVVVDKNVHVIENLSGLRPTSELLMHLKAYEARPDIKAVAHTHSMYATSFAVLGKTIPAIVYELQALGAKRGYVPVAPYGRPGTYELADHVADTLKDSDVALMEKHGTIGVGSDIYDAFLKVSYLEELAQMYYNVLTVNGGKEPEALPPSEIVQWAYPKEVIFS
ncbi:MULTISPECIES: class II aldolase/adducin family protein [unclassified Sporolactobacillus]|uniref:class II aldolase/adducin family protein n=1 Tax=unclassified Sporolactobacillus TaxID=2628533 RepID=UPI002367771C|nr:class II aldolase/adducin family protein [Sporolactobacillus sp. CQH2019]MDD9147741.1 class II aldolase/adducin family protein [Sporolactobacillus sp. CQH2019]